jgi:general secretion pathway protein D
MRKEYIQKKNQKIIAVLLFIVLYPSLLAEQEADNALLQNELLSPPNSLQALPLNEIESDKTEETKQLEPEQEQIEKIVTLPDSSDDLELDDSLDEEELLLHEEENEKNELRKNHSQAYHLAEFIQPWDSETENETTRVNFQNASLTEFINFIQNTYKVTFITDESIDPINKDAARLSANTIHFKSHWPLNKKDLWNLFTTFLDMSGFALVPGNNPRIFKIINADPKIANKTSLPSYIGVDYSLLPDNDIKIRYVYFVANADINNLLPVIDSMRSSRSEQVLSLPEMRAIIITDKSSVIRSIMKIITELDTAASPEVMSIIRLKKATASKVATFYKELTETEENSNSFIARMQKKESNTSPFSRVRVIAEPRTNSLIVFGTREAVPLVEEFIKSHIDKDVALTHTGTHIYYAKFIDATSTAALLKNITQFDTQSDAALYGGIRDGQKYFKTNVDFVPERLTNSIIIKADYEDYLKVLELLNKIDIEQPQVAIKVAVVDIDITDTRGLNTQIRNTNYGTNTPPAAGPTGLNGIAGRNFAFQTSGFNGNGVVENTETGSTGSTRLLGDLIKLATGSPQGSTLITLAQDSFGIAGILQLLQTYTKSTLVANPYLITTHNNPASIVIGEERRIVNGTVSGGGGRQSGITAIAANLVVKVKPIIAANGTVSLEVDVEDNKFTTTGADPNTAGDRTMKHVTTKAIIQNKGVLALGGFVSDSTYDSETKVPVLGDIPLFGWLFKTKNKLIFKSSLLILISVEIVKSEESKENQSFTQDKIEECRKNLQLFDQHIVKKDPIYSWFFSPELRKESVTIDQFIASEGNYLTPAEKSVREKKESSKNNTSITKNKKLTQLLAPEKSRVPS